MMISRLFLSDPGSRRFFEVASGLLFGLKLSPLIAGRKDANLFLSCDGRELLIFGK